MRHKRGNKKLSKPTDQRIALLRSLSLALIQHERLVTTDVRAKEVRGYIERLISLAKRGDLHARRRALAMLPSQDAIHRLFSIALDRFGSRNGGYTRLVKLGFRRGDGAALSKIEFC